MHEIAELGRASLGVARFLESALQTIRRRIPFDRGNIALFDPATAMPTFLLLDPGCASEFVARTCAFEMTSGDDSTFHNLAHRPRPAVRSSGERHRAIQLRRRNASANSQATCRTCLRPLRPGVVRA